MSNAEVDEALEESFLASDPPSWTLGTDSHTLRGREASKRDGKPGMRADVALAKSTERLIVAETPLGWVTIYHQAKAENSGEAFTCALSRAMSTGT